MSWLPDLPCFEVLQLFAEAPATASSSAAPSADREEAAKAQNKTEGDQPRIYMCIYIYIRI